IRSTLSSSSLMPSSGQGVSHRNMYRACTRLMSASDRRTSTSARKVCTVLASCSRVGTVIADPRWKGQTSQDVANARERLGVDQANDFLVNPQSRRTGNQAESYVGSVHALAAAT